jgi:hypothetical protein
MIFQICQRCAQIWQCNMKTVPALESSRDTERCEILGQRCARLLKQQLSITIYRLPTDENKHLIFRFRSQQTNGSLLFLLSVCSKQGKIAVFFPVRFRFRFTGTAPIMPCQLTILQGNKND